MPELPEVETMVRGIRAAVEGRRLLGVELPPCAYRPISIAPAFEEIRERVAGRRVSTVFRRAKRVVLELESGDAFVIEPRMTGLMLLADPPDPEHLRFCWRLGEGGETGGARDHVRPSLTRRATGASAATGDLWFWDRRGLGTIRLLDPEGLRALCGTGKLGPDALEMTTELWRGLGERTSRPIKVALLDQSLVAGIGNLYASEILHLAGVHPETRTDRISAARWGRIGEACREILELAIRYEGSTLGDGTYRNALNKSGGYQNAHRVYDREGETCPTCGRGEVTRIVQGQRSTFFCAKCQRVGRK
jgi:formamidopyrimidine-DNA glycosylase